MENKEDFMKAFGTMLSDCVLQDDNAPENLRLAAGMVKLSTIDVHQYSKDVTISQDTFRAANEKIFAAIKLVEEAEEILKIKPIEVSAETYERWELGR